MIITSMRHKSLTYIVTFLSLAMVLAGCGGGKNKEVLARIDDKYTVTLEDFQSRIEKLPPQYQDFINQNKKEFLDELVVDILLYNEAMKKNLAEDTDVKKVFEEAQKKILIARLLQDEVEKKITISDEDVSRYYAENKERFRTPESLRASHILVKSEAEANDVLAELKKGGNFEDLARERSVDPTAKEGGDIGYFTRRQLVPEFEEACFKMEVGETSGVVKTDFGYHIIKLTEKREPRVKEREEVQPAIEQALRRLKKKVVFNEFVEKLRERSRITINSELLTRIEEENPEQTKVD